MPTPNSTKSLENSYADFIHRMRQPQARPLLASIRHFLSRFDAIPDPDKDAEYRLFMERLVDGVVEVVADADRFPRLLVAECVEYLVTNQLGERAMSSLTDETAESALMLKMVAFNWLQPRHIGYTAEAAVAPDAITTIAPDLEQYMQLAVEELEQLCKYKTPRDKQTLLLNACRLVCGGLGERVSADDLLPCLIVTVVRARPPYLLATLRYIQSYKLADCADANERFLFTNCLAAVAFIQHLDRKAVKCDDQEFDLMMESSQSMVSQYQAEYEALRHHRIKKSNSNNDLLTDIEPHLRAIESRAKQVFEEWRKSDLVIRVRSMLAGDDAVGDGDDDRERRELELAMALSLSESVVEAAVGTDC